MRSQGTLFGAIVQSVAILAMFGALIWFSRPAWAGPDQEVAVERLRPRAEKAVLQAVLTLVDDHDGSETRALRALRRSDRALTRATRSATSKAQIRRVARIHVRVLNRQARIHLERGALRKAEKLNERALHLETRSVEALQLRGAIARAGNRDLFDGAGRAQVERRRELRRAAGAPVRDRGVARRR